MKLRSSGVVGHAKYSDGSIPPQEPAFPTNHGQQMTAGFNPFAMQQMLDGFNPHAVQQMTAGFNPHAMQQMTALQQMTAGLNSHATVAANSITPNLMNNLSSVEKEAAEKQPIKKDGLAKAQRGQLVGLDIDTLEEGGSVVRKAVMSEHRRSGGNSSSSSSNCTSNSPLLNGDSGGIWEDYGHLLNHSDGKSNESNALDNDTDDSEFDLNLIENSNDGSDISSLDTVFESDDENLS